MSRLTTTLSSEIFSFLILSVLIVVPVKGDVKSVSDEQLSRGTDDTSGWYHYGGNFENWRYSPLEQINRQNVSRLTPAWIFQTGIPGQMTNSPIIADGVLYVTSVYNHAWALDARTGDTLWHYQHQLPGDLRICCGPANRGVAIHGDKIFMATLDAHLVALNRESG